MLDRITDGPTDCGIAYLAEGHSATSRMAMEWGSGVYTGCSGLSGFAGLDVIGVASGRARSFTFARSSSAVLM